MTDEWINGNIIVIFNPLTAYGHHSQSFYIDGVLNPQPICNRDNAICSRLQQFIINHRQ